MHHVWVSYTRLEGLNYKAQILQKLLTDSERSLCFIFIGQSELPVILAVLVGGYRSEVPAYTI